MEKLGFIKLLKKISYIIFEHDVRKYVTAAIYFRWSPDVLFINVNGIHAKDQGWWEENLVAIITHEDIHGVLYRIGGLRATWALDKICSTTLKSWFLVDGNWGLLK